MHISHVISNSLISRKQSLVLLIALLAVFGTVTELLAGVWDSTSHLMRAPEFFWSMQHVVVYAGVGMVTCSAILGSLIVANTKNKKTLNMGLKILIVGAVLQITAGYADSISHDIYGIDGLVTPSHLVLETGLLLSAFGGFMTLCQTDKQKIKKIIPIAIATVLLSAAWI